MPSMRRHPARQPLRRVVILAATAAALAGTGGLTSALASSTPATARSATAEKAAATAQAAAGEPYSCAPNGPAGSQTIYGTFGDASVIGWTGNSEAVTACLGGSFFVTTGNGPGSGATGAVQGTSYGYGIYNDTRTT